ncbi:MAG: tRNA (adenosine(37)-N6)-dimethylallyltransferase MiaA [Desulfobacteraceae bacterium]|nr:tRNA (adenosine(37)-N6)-dimethylallyltransferase MiaA [Desulfobacteraceae bacterium]
MDKLTGVALIGPTGIGKTALSLEVAERFGGEIVSVDSMQVFRFMDVGTAKATLDERARVVHHLINIAFPDEAYNVARFAADAARAMTVIRERGRLPLLVGGTGLYLKGLLKGLFAIQEDPGLRRVLKARAEAEGLASLHAELARCDPEAAARVHPRDSHRILRGLEVFLATGKPWSAHLADQERADGGQKVLKIGLACDREDLYRRIDRRVDFMVEQGLQGEVENLLALGYDGELKPMQAIGYWHMINYLDGTWSREESLHLLARDTRRYAKRQLTWFRRDPGVAWFHPGQHQEIFAAIDRFLANPQREGTRT